MHTEIDFKKLWNNAPKSDVPDATEIIKKGNQMQRKARNKMLISNALLAATFVFITWVWIHYQPQMLTTKIGIVLVMIALVFYLVTSIGYISLLYKDNLEANSSEYLQHMLKIQHEQEALNTRMTSIYFVLLCAGLALYMIEYLRMMSTLWAWVYGGLTFAWLAFNVFFIHRRIIKKQRDKINTVILKLEEVNGQLTKE